MHRLALILLILCFPLTALAQQPRGMDPAEMMRRFQDPAAMQRMQEEAMAAQQCMEGITKAELETLEKQGKAASEDIEALCAAGQKAKAMARALELSREMNSNPTVKKIRECTKKMPETQRMMQSMPWSSIPGVEDEAPPREDDLCS